MIDLIHIERISAAMNKSKWTRTDSYALAIAFLLAIITFLSVSSQSTDTTVDKSQMVETVDSTETFETTEIPLSSGVYKPEFISGMYKEHSEATLSNPFTVTEEFSESSKETSEVLTEEETEESVGESIETISSIESIGETIEEPTVPEYDLSDVPLSDELCDIIVTECTNNNVPIPVALAVINTESNFTDGLWSTANCYGLMQLHASYFQDIYTPEDNLRTGITFLGSLIDKHGDIYIALNVYANGHCTYDFSHQNYVMRYAEEWSAKTGAPIYI